MERQKWKLLLRGRHPISRQLRCRRLASDICARMGRALVSKPYFPRCVCPGHRNHLNHHFVSAWKLKTTLKLARHAKQIEKLNLTWRAGVIAVSRVPQAPLVPLVFVSVGSSRECFPNVPSPCSPISCSGGIEGC